MGPTAAAAWCLSAGMMYRLEEVVARRAEIVVPGNVAGRPPADVYVRRSNDHEALMIRRVVANGLGNFTREFPLEWRGRRYYFDFAFEPSRLIVETNGRRFHDDPIDYEYDQEKWRVPARYGYRIVRGIVEGQ